FVCHLITLSQDLIAYGDGASLNWPQEEVVLPSGILNCGDSWFGVGKNIMARDALRRKQLFWWLN
ncbi:hypothetical protein ACJX0J_020132, partial [Zea mays]